MSNYKDGLHLVPDHMRHAVVGYFEHGISPGHFLTAVLCNDLMESFGRADNINRAAMPQWCEFLYMYAPSGSHGSPEKVQRWVETHRVAREAAHSSDRPAP